MRTDWINFGAIKSYSKVRDEQIPFQALRAEAQNTTRSRTKGLGLSPPKAKKGHDFLVSPKEDKRLQDRKHT